tara:strand:- start:204 stop:860 length:657 start_codon:yes stop_codon:yes gene_type:complete
MIISDKKKFVFIHIPKTGGTSIENSLLKYANLRQKIVSYYPTKYLIYLINRSNINLLDNGNKWINGFHRHETIKYLNKSKKYNSYFKFTVVRNPYSWFASLYNYIQISKRHKLYEIVKNYNLDEFLDLQIKKKIFRQTDYIFNKDAKYQVDRIIKLEKINQEIEILKKKFCIDLELLHLNKSKTANNIYFQNKESLNKFNKYFEKDFLELNYNFIKFK